MRGSSGHQNIPGQSAGTRGRWRRRSAGCSSGWRLALGCSWRTAALEGRERGRGVGGKEPANPEKSPEKNCEGQPVVHALHGECDGWESGRSDGSSRNCIPLLCGPLIFWVVFQFEDWRWTRMNFQTKLQTNTTHNQMGKWVVGWLADWIISCGESEALPVTSAC